MNMQIISNKLAHASTFWHTTLTLQESKTYNSVLSDLNKDSRIYLRKMTFEDEHDVRPRLCLQNTMGVGDSLKALLKQAQIEGRLTCGILESAQILEENPDNVMMCVLPDVGTLNDVTLQIHFTLIEAFCWENDIHLLKVDCSEKLSKILENNTSKAGPVNDNDITSGRSSATSDFNCLLVEYPRESATPEEEYVVEFCKHNSDFTPQPVVQLPV